MALGVTGAVVAGGIAMLASGGGDGSEDEPVTQAAYCVDTASGLRVEDSSCEAIDPAQQDLLEGEPAQSSDGHGGLGWYFIPFGLRAPAIGGRASGGSFAVPSSSYVTGGVPRAGGSVSPGNVTGGKTTTVRGGFGSKGGGVGG